jgi:DNA modification methylase
MILLKIHPDIRVGPMTLIIGDCRHVLADLSEEDEKADLLCTDPPYKLTSGGKTKVKGKGMSGKFAPDKYDNSGVLMKITPWGDMPEPLFNACRPNCDAYIMADSKNIFEARNAFIGHKWKVHELLNWKKESPSRTRYYMKNTEYILYLWKGKARDINNGGSTQDMPYPRPKNAIHPTQKPLGLLKEMIGNSSQPGECVLDPFAGSASTLVAAMQLGRRSLGIEFCPENAARAAVWMQKEWDDQRRREDAGEIALAS